MAYSSTVSPSVASTVIRISVRVGALLWMDACSICCLCRPRRLTPWITAAATDGTNWFQVWWAPIMPNVAHCALHSKVVNLPLVMSTLHYHLPCCSVTAAVVADQAGGSSWLHDIQCVAAAALAGRTNALAYTTRLTLKRENDEN